jgi:hypothetical protein
VKILLKGRREGRNEKSQIISGDKICRRMMQATLKKKKKKKKRLYEVITNDVSDYINLLVRIAHIICNQLGEKPEGRGPLESA